MTAACSSLSSINSTRRSFDKGSTSSHGFRGSIPATPVKAHILNHLVKLLCINRFDKVAVRMKLIGSNLVHFRIRSSQNYHRNAPQLLVSLYLRQDFMPVHFRKLEVQ